MTLPPPTAESRQQTVKAAVDLGDKANLAVKNARATQQKRHRAMSLQKAARPDDMRKANDRWEKLVSEGSAQIKKLVDGAKKALESG